MPYVLVIGDVLIDHYITGSVHRVSPEAPVPVLNYQSEYVVPGGAGNVASNLASLGCKPVLIGSFGKGVHANTILSLLSSKSISCIDLNPDGNSNVKTRVLDSSQQLVRIDHESPNLSAYPYLLDHRELIENASLIILSDYNKGTLSDSVGIISLAQEYGKKVFVDPKQNSLEGYRGAYCITPNLREYALYAKQLTQTNLLQVWDQDQFCTSAELIQQEYNIQNVLCTRSSDGHSLLTDAGNYIEERTLVHKVFDVTGAGDTFIAALATEYQRTSSLEQAGKFASQAASIAVQYSGTYSVSYIEVASSKHQPEDTASLEMLRYHVDSIRAKGKTIAVTNGCFDILHYGHIQCLEYAKSTADYLIVLVNSDSSITRLKGASRPINGLENRLRLLKALWMVDYVFPFEDDAPTSLIELISPDFLIKGGDYTVDEIAGSQHVLSSGGKVLIYDTVVGYSTTSLIHKCKIK
jgi:D-beta-D-heptose 7-phosphate kinase/D-beta-D-heptose 1-phosphate adenosyltransferase